MDPYTRALAHKLDSLSRKVDALSVGPQLGFSSLEDGAIRDYDANGELAGVIGKLPDGTHGHIAVNGPLPPNPSAPSLVARDAGAVITWGGTFIDAAAPLDLARIEAHIIDNPAADLQDRRADGQINGASPGSVSVNLDSGQYWGRLVAVTTSGQRANSPLVGPIIVTSAPAPDPVAPTSSPALTITGTAETLIARAEAFAADQMVEYHLSTDEDFVPVLGDPATLSGPLTRAPMHVAVGVPGGGLLDPDATYYMRTIAHNEAGTAEPGPVAEGQLDLTAVTELVLARIQAGFGLFGEIQVGSHTWSPDDGLRIPQPNGQVIHLPADGSAAQLAAHVIALSLTIRDRLTLQGHDNRIDSGSSLTVNSGVSAPQQAPTVERFYPNIELVDGGLRGSQRGLTMDASASQWMTATAFFGGRLEMRTLDGVLHNWSAGDAGINFEGGVTRLGSSYYALGVGIGGGPRDGRWFVRRFNTALTQTGEWEWEPGTPSWSHRPAIGTDGTNIVIAWRAPTNTVIRRYSPATGARVEGEIVHAHGGQASHCTSVHWGGADLGGHVIVTNLRTITAYTTDGVRVAEREWSLAGAENILGLAWDGNRFHHLDTTGRLWTYSAMASDWLWDIDFSWFDSDPAGTGIHETDRGPATTFLQRARSFFRVHTGIPYDTGEPDDPDSVRIWAGGFRQPDLGRGVTVAEYEIPDTGTTSKAPGFASAGSSVGFVASAEPDGWRLNGDGTTRFRWPELDHEPATLAYLTPSHAHRTATGLPNIGSGDIVPINWNVAESADGIAWSPAQRGFVITAAGRYDIDASIAYGSNSSGQRDIRILVNDPNPTSPVGPGVTGNRIAAGSSGITPVQLHDWLDLAAGDLVQICAHQTGATSLGFNHSPWLTYAKLARRPGPTP